MVQKNTTKKIIKGKPKFFLLLHQVIGLYSLKGLTREGYIPEFVIIHNDFEIDKLKVVFYEPIEKWCSRYNIPLFKVDFIVEKLNEISACDFGFCVGFMEIIKPEVFSRPKLGIFNLHCGKLPDYRGRAPVSRAIINGDKFIYITIHKIDKGIDSGDILLEKKIPISPTDDVNTLYRKCSMESPRVLIEAYNKLSSGKFVLKKQKSSNKSNKKISEQERLINWNSNVTTVNNLIRALLPPYPPAYAYYKGQKVYVCSARIISRNKRTPGKICDVASNFIDVECKNGTIRLFKLLDEQNRPINLKQTFKIDTFFDK
jgi:methionyl-tRNA formyltransferase